MTHLRWSHAGGVMLLGALLTGCSAVDDPTEPPAQVLHALSSVSTDASAPAPVIEPAALARVQQSLSRSPENLRIHTRPDGLHDVEVLSGFQHMTIFARQADGTLRSHCTSDADEATHLLSRRAP